MASAQASQTKKLEQVSLRSRSEIDVEGYILYIAGVLHFVIVTFSIMSCVMELCIRHYTALIFLYHILQKH